ncbi:hypothetical protein [Cytobacillus oceanisediminis]|uniref:hypothetical protein n=1 Tax=Cytobacillus oceanisediminis TaxID=665099 RepID=UPI00373644F5
MNIVKSFVDIEQSNQMIPYNPCTATKIIEHRKFSKRKKLKNFLRLLMVTSKAIIMGIFAYFIIIKMDVSKYSPLVLNTRPVVSSSKSPD